MKNKLFIMLLCVVFNCKTSDTVAFVKHEKTFSTDSIQVLNEEAFDSDVEEKFSRKKDVFIINVPYNTPESFLEQDQKNILGRDREIITGIATFLIGCSGVLFFHSINNCPGEKCLWTGGVPWY